MLGGDTLYIAGTKSVQDGLDDLLIPFGMTSRTHRYKNAEALLLKNPQVRRVVGHSLGGSVSLELSKNYNLGHRTYGAPVVSATSSTDRFRHYLDPISWFDWGAQSSVHFPNPHTYRGFQ